jgi:hypothetical protein
MKLWQPGGARFFPGAARIGASRRPGMRILRLRFCQQSFDFNKAEIDF